MTGFLLTAKQKLMLCINKRLYWLEWDYQILRRDGSTAAVIRKELFHWTDTYTIETEYDEDALCALMVVLAIDADKCGSA